MIAMKYFFSLSIILCLTANVFSQEKDKLYILNAVEIDSTRYDDHDGSAYFFDDYTLVDVMSIGGVLIEDLEACLLYTSPSPRDQRGSRMPSSA